MSGPPIPVTVIGGYLGAGKTTLLNRILRGDHGRRLAVIVNDFGDVVVDEMLLEPAAGGVRALANGCVCCSAVDGLATALAELRALDPAPEHLLIEVSGVGDPRAVAQWGRTPGHTLDGVVVVVDPGTIRDWAADRYVGDTIARQLAGADLVLLSRADVTPAPTCAAVAAWLGERSDAPVLVGTDQPLSVLLGVGVGGDGAGPNPVGATTPPHAEHRAVTVAPPTTDRAGLAAWLAAAPHGVVRVKGITAGDPRLLVHVVGRRVELTTTTLGATPLVVIATAEVDPAALTRWTAAGPDTA